MIRRYPIIVMRGVDVKKTLFFLVYSAFRLVMPKTAKLTMKSSPVLKTLDPLISLLALRWVFEL
jgi:hypothetical protein